MELVDFFAERLDVKRALQDSGDLSLINTFGTDLPRVFIVAAASNFETAVTRHIKDYFLEATGNLEEVSSFMDNRALFRNYHSLFSWKETNPHYFFSHFGGACLDHYKAMASSVDGLKGSAVKFLELGRARNELVHGDFAVHSPSMTPEEVRDAYVTASQFVRAIPAILRRQQVSLEAEVLD